MAGKRYIVSYVCSVVSGAVGAGKKERIGGI